MEPTAGPVEILGRRIHEIRGGAGRPLLYLHSTMGEATWLTPHLVALARHYQVYAPAHPGFLDSEGIEQIRHVEDLVYHYLAYLDAKGWQAVDVVGLSLGGWIAAELAARYPERVAKLVLVDAVGIWVPEQPMADLFAIDGRFPERLRDLLFHDPSVPAARAMAVGIGAELPDAVLAHVVKAFAATAKIGWNPLLHDPRLEGLLHRVTAPTLCLWGSHDRVVPLAYGEKYAKLIPGARLEVVPDCGHLLPFERPDAFTNAVRDFLG